MRGVQDVNDVVDHEGQFFGSVRPDGEEPLDGETVQLIDDWIASNPGGRERLIPLLHHVQRHLGYLPPAAQRAVADRLDMSPVQVYGVISFYHFFTTTPRGRYQVKVCTGTACFVRGAQRVLDVFADELGVETGGVSEDRSFNLDQVRCIGACGLAPAVMVNDDVHGNLDSPGARKLAKKLKRQAKKEAAAQAEEAGDEH